VAVDVPLEGGLGLLLGRFGATLRADRPLATVAGMQWPGTGKAALFNAAEASTDLVVPLVVKYGESEMPDGLGPQTFAYRYHRSYIYVQNTDPLAPAHVEAELRGPGAGGPVAATDWTIPPGGMVEIDVESDPAFAAVPERFHGGLRLRADRPIAAYSLLDATNTSKAIAGFEGVPATRASDRLYAPLFRAEFAGFTTSIVFTNPGAAPVDVTVTYHASHLSFAAACKAQGTTFVHNGGPVTVPAGATVAFQQYSGLPSETGRSTLPGGCLGSAVIEVAGGEGLAVVVDENLSVGSASAHLAFGRDQAAQRVAIPLYQNRFGPEELSAGFQAMNTSDRPASLTLYIWNASGLLLTSPCAECGTTIAPFASHTWYPPTMFSQLENANMEGSAIIDSNAPVVVLVNSVNTRGTRDQSIYAGVPLDPPGTLTTSPRHVPLVRGARRARVALPLVGQSLPGVPGDPHR